MKAASQHSGPTDAETLKNYRSTGDKKYIGVLYDRYSMLVYGICLKYLKNREDAQDAVIRIFEQLMEDLRKKEVDTFPAWLSVVARNHCLMQLRKKTPPRSNQENELEGLRTDSSLEEKVMLESRLEMLEQAIQELSTEQQQSIQLFYLEKRPYKEVAEIMEVDEKKVKSLIQNGKRNLRILMTSGKLQPNQP